MSFQWIIKAMRREIKTRPHSLLRPARLHSVNCGFFCFNFFHFWRFFCEWFRKLVCLQVLSWLITATEESVLLFKHPPCGSFCQKTLRVIVPLRISGSDHCCRWRLTAYVFCFFCFYKQRINCKYWATVKWKDPCLLSSQGHCDVVTLQKLHNPFWFNGKTSQPLKQEVAPVVFHWCWKHTTAALGFILSTFSFQVVQ